MKFHYLLILFIAIISPRMFSQQLNWEKTSGTTINSIKAEPGKGYMIVKSHPSQLILPETPDEGDIVGFMDISGTFSQKPLKVDPGRIPIEGSTGIKVFRTANVSITLIYSSTHFGWRILTTNDAVLADFETLFSSENPSNSNSFLPSIIHFGGIGDGKTDNSIAFKNAFDKVDELIIPSGNYLIKGNLAIPPSKKIIFSNGAIIDVTGSLIGNNTIVQADMHQIFSLSSNILGTWNVGHAYVEWFGAKGDGTGKSDMAAFQKTLETFCRPVEYKTGWKIYLKAQGNKVYALGNYYIVEKTLDFPGYGWLEMNTNTLLAADKSGYGFMGTYINITQEPYYISGGRLLVRKYDEIENYLTLPDAEKTTENKLKYSYNSNPVMRLYLSRETQDDDNIRYPDRQSRFPSFIRDMIFRPTNVWYESNRSPFSYNGIEISPDTTEIPQGDSLVVGNYYSISEYHLGDDFTNVGALKDYDSTKTHLSTNTWYIITQDVADFSNVGASSNKAGTIFKTPYNGQSAITPIDWGTGKCRLYNKEYFYCTDSMPANWSNGSKIRINNNIAIANTFENISFYMADTALYMIGDRTRGLFASWHFNNMSFDVCYGAAIVLDVAAHGQLFTNTFINAPNNSQPYGKNPQIIINSNNNQISGFMWDSWHDSTIIIHKGVTNNKIDLGHPYLEEIRTTDNTLHSMNNIGWNHLWANSVPTYVQSPYSKYDHEGNYNFYGKSASIGFYGNWRNEKQKTSFPRGILEVVSDSSFPFIPAFIAESYNPKANNIIPSMLIRSTSPSKNPKRGFGVGIDFTIGKDNDSIAMSNKVGSFNVMLSNNNDLNNSTIQIVNLQDGNLKPALEIENDGTVLIYGDLQINGILKETGKYSGAGEKKPTVTDLVKIEPKSSPPINPTEGMVYINSNDHHIYCYLNGYWKQID